MTRVEISITEWTWVVSLYYRGVIGYNFPPQNIALFLLRSVSVGIDKMLHCASFIRIFCVFKTYS